jgi:HlyD family secretion protein
MFSKKNRKWTLGVIALLVAGFFVGRYLYQRRTALPKGFASGNGRIESREVDVASKLPLKVKDVLVDEGDLVKPGQVVAHMDTITLEADLAEANAGVASAEERLKVVKAGIVKASSEVDLAKIEKARSRRLVAQRAGSQRDYDVRTAALETTSAGLTEQKGKLNVAQEEVEVARAKVAVVESRIHDATLVSPVVGRVLYRLANPGEVVGAGGKVLTLVDLSDVYMEIFLPSNQAASVKIGDEARFTVDYAPERVGVGSVTFVSPEAQFTPKEVETRSEREKLMFRVKIQVPEEVVQHYVERVKTGVRGVGYVKLDPSAEWPSWLNKNLVKPGEAERKRASAPAAPVPPAAGQE